MVLKGSKVWILPLHEEVSIRSVVVFFFNSGCLSCHLFVQLSNCATSRTERGSPLLFITLCSSKPDEDDHPIFEFEESQLIFKSTKVSYGSAPARGFPGIGGRKRYLPTCPDFSASEVFFAFCKLALAFIFQLVALLFDLSTVPQSHFLGLLRVQGVPIWG